MATWRRKALEFLPELRSTIASAESPMALWIELHLEFDEVMEKGDLASAQRFLRFAAWCLTDESGPLPNDTSTAAALAFYEHLPQKRAYWPHFSRWFTTREVEVLLPIFSYHLDATEFVELRRHLGVPPNTSFERTREG